MKFLSFSLLALFALAQAEEWKPKLPEEIKVLRAECLKNHPIADDVIEKMKNLEFPNEEPVRHYILCSAKKMGIFCEHEGYHADRVVQQFKLDLDEEEILNIVQNCTANDKNEQKSSIDEWAFRGHQCFMKSKIGDRVKEYIKKQKEKAAAEAAAAKE